MKRQYLIIEHRSNKSLDYLRSEIQKREEQYNKLLKDFRSLEMKYGEEVMLNSELIDILKSNSIQYRLALDHSYRSSNILP